MTQKRPKTANYHIEIPRKQLSSYNMSTLELLKSVQELQEIWVNSQKDTAWLMNSTILFTTSFKFLK